MARKVGAPKHAVGGPKKKGDEEAGKKRRWRSGTKALMDIRGMQGITSKRHGKHNAATCRLVQRLPMSRLIREILQDIAGGDPNAAHLIAADAVDALHEAAEALLVSRLNLAQSCATHRKVVGVHHKDMRLAGYASECPEAALSAREDPTYNAQKVSWLPTNKVSHIDIKPFAKGGDAKAY